MGMWFVGGEEGRKNKRSLRKPVKKKAFKRAKRYKIRNSEEIRIQYTVKFQEREILKTAEVTKPIIKQLYFSEDSTLLKARETHCL